MSKTIIDRLQQRVLLYPDDAVVTFRAGDVKGLIDALKKAGVREDKYLALISSLESRVAELQQEPVDAQATLKIRNARDLAQRWLTDNRQVGPGFNSDPRWVHREELSRLAATLLKATE